jgi:hypothetical protein
MGQQVVDVVADEGGDEEDWEDVEYGSHSLSPCYHVLRDISTYPPPIYFILLSRAFPPAKLTCLTDRRYYLR